MEAVIKYQTERINRALIPPILILRTVTRDCRSVIITWEPTQDENFSVRKFSNRFGNNIGFVYYFMIYLYSVHILINFFFSSVWWFIAELYTPIVCLFTNDHLPQRTIEFLPLISQILSSSPLTYGQLYTSLLSSYSFWLMQFRIIYTFGKY